MIEAHIDIAYVWGGLIVNKYLQQKVLFSTQQNYIQIKNPKLLLTQ